MSHGGGGGGHSGGGHSGYGHSGYGHHSGHGGQHITHAPGLGHHNGGSWVLPNGLTGHNGLIHILAQAFGLGHHVTHHSAGHSGTQASHSVSPTNIWPALMKERFASFSNQKPTLSSLYLILVLSCLVAWFFIVYTVSHGGVQIAQSKNGQITKPLEAGMVLGEGQFQTAFGRPENSQAYPTVNGYAANYDSPTVRRSDDMSTSITTTEPTAKRVVTIVTR